MITNYRNLMGCAIAIFLVVAQPAVAQQRYNGIWNKISLQTWSGSAIQDFGFKDSLFGLARDYAGIETTTDGGHTWQFDTNFLVIGTKLYLNSVTTTGYRTGIIFGSPGINEYTTVVLPENSFQIYAPEGGDNGFGLYLPIAEHMTDTTNGYRLVQEQDQHAQLIDSVIFLVTHDAWQNSVSYGSAYVWSGPQDIYPSSNNFYSGLIIDSNETWTANINTILHTTNAGEMWDSILPVDTTRYKPQWKDFFVDTTTKEVYAEAQYSDVDFAYSSDYGKTWRLDSTFGQGLWRMAVPTPGIIWGMLGNGGIANITITPQDVNQNPLAFSNKVAYSTDTGKTWFIDSTTFAGDTLLEMHFTDARHGWIAGYANGDSHIWYYDPFLSFVNSSIQSGSGGVSIPYLVVYPDPAQNTITISGSTLASGTSLPLSIFDPLGRRYFCPQMNASIDISSLSSGIYFVNDGYVSGKFVKE